MKKLQSLFSPAKRNRESSDSSDSVTPTAKKHGRHIDSSSPRITSSEQRRIETEINNNLHTSQHTPHTSTIMA